MGWYCRAPASSTSSRTRTARSSSTRPAGSSRRTPTSGSRRSSSTSGTRTARTRTGARRATSRSASRGGTPSTSTRSRCPRRPCRSARRARGDLANGGWLATSSGGKLNFGFDAEQVGAANEGELQLNDKGAARRSTSSAGRRSGRSATTAAPWRKGRTRRARGTGRFNGAGGKEFRVCVEDGGEGQGAVDRLHLECTAGCTYDTEGRGADETLDGGNVDVVRRTEPLTGDTTPTTLILDPVLAGTSVLGQPQVFTVRAFGGDGQPLPGASVALTGAGQTLTGLTSATGIATFVVPAGGIAEYTALSGGVQSNAIELRPGL